MNLPLRDNLVLCLLTLLSKTADWCPLPEAALWVLANLCSHDVCGFQGFSALASLSVCVRLWNWPLSVLWWAPVIFLIPIETDKDLAKQSSAERCCPILSLSHCVPSCLGGRMQKLRCFVWERAQRGQLSGCRSHSCHKPGTAASLRSQRGNHRRKMSVSP